MSAETRVRSIAPESRQTSKRRKWAFRLIAVLLAFSPFLIGEVICRIAGFGGYPPVLKKMNAHQGSHYVGTYQPGINTFFWQNLSSTGSMEERVFLTPKPDGRTRIMTFGGSAMRGFPQPRPLVSTSFLQAMLEDVWPDRDLEVLNFGTTAVASFPVMYIVDEALEYEPDLVIIYSGNNEFYGAHGVASLHSFGQSTWSMKALRAMRQTGIGQWVADFQTRRQADAASVDPNSRSKSLMESVIKDGQIGPEDSRRAAASANLENHLTSMIKACNARGVPVIVCTLPANERNMAPLGQDGSVSLHNAQLLLVKNPVEALPAIESLVEQHPRHAGARFLLGQCLTAMGRDRDAKEHYLVAKEYDPMPWRAPGSISEVVRDVASRHGAILCDLERAFQTASPGGATGWELMDDHVHPTLQGQALIATSLLKSMAKLSGGLRVNSIASLGPWEAYAETLGANEYDRFGVQHRMRTLFRAPFYAESNPEALARAEALCAKYKKGFSESELNVIEYWQKPEAHGGGFRPITGFVGNALLREGNYSNADRVLSIARRSVAEYSLWNLELTWKVLNARSHLRPAPSADDIALAKEMIEDGETMYRATGVRSPELCRHLGLAYRLVGDHRRALPDLNIALKSVSDIADFAIVKAYVDSLVKTGQKDKAVRVLKSPLKDRKLSDACRELLRRLEASASSS